jgi:hypothetical protein
MHDITKYWGGGQEYDTLYVNLRLLNSLIEHVET